MSQKKPHETRDDGFGVPLNLRGAWLYGGDARGRGVGPATDHHMRVRARFGRGYSSAHAGSVAADARRSQLEQSMDAAGLWPRQRQAMELVTAGLELPEIAARMGLTYGSAKSLLRDARRRLREHAEALRIDPPKEAADR